MSYVDGFHTRPRQHAWGRNSPGQSLPNLCAELGISYRTLDNWITTGRIVLSVPPPPGPGYHRRVTAADAAAIRLVLRRQRRIDRLQADVTSGDYFRRVVQRR